MVRIGAVQMDIRLGDPGWNMDRILRHSERTEADLLVFPECSNSGYAFNNAEEALRYAEQVPGPLSEALQNLARTSGRSFVVGILEKDSTGQLRNTAVLITPDRPLQKYWKTHLPYVGVDRFVTAGDELPVFETHFGRVGILICYDWRFPEAARCLALQGAELLIGPTNWLEGAKAIPDFLVPARAAENNVFVVMASRVGSEGGDSYIGQSAIIHSSGRHLASLSDREGVLVEGIDLEQARNKRLIKRAGEYEIDLFGDRRPDLYSRLIRE